MAKTIKPVPTSAEQFTTAEEKIAALMARDIMFVKEDLKENNYSFLIEIMSGDYWTQYANLCPESLELEFNELVEQFHEDNLDLWNNESYVEVLKFLWHIYFDGIEEKID